LAQRYIIHVDDKDLSVNFLQGWRKKMSSAKE